MEYIKTVKENGDSGYLVNGTMSVPKADAIGTIETFKHGLKTAV